MVIAEAKSSLDVPVENNDSVRRRFAIGAFWALVGAVISRGLTLAASVVAGRLLGTTGFGEVGMIQSTQGLFGVLAGAGMGLAATKFVAEYRATDRAKAGRCVSLALLVALAAGALASVVLLVISSAVASSVLHAPHLVTELQIATGLLFFGTLNGVQTGAIVGLGNFRTVAILNIIRGVCLFVMLIVGIYLAGVMGGVIGLVVTEGIAVLVNQIALQRLLPELRMASGGRTPRDSATWNELITMCRFSGFALLGSICTTLALWFSNVVLVSQTDGYAALGIFNAADRWRQLLLFLPATISPLILSMLSNLHGKNDPAAYRQLVSANLWISVIVVLVPSAGIALGAPLAMGLFGEEYRDGWMTLVILAASSIAVVFNNVLGQILVSQGAIWGRFLLDVLLAVVLALVCWQLIPLYHDQGMAWGHLAAYAVTAIALVLPAIYYIKKRATQANDSPELVRR